MIGKNNTKALSVFAALVLLTTAGRTSGFQLRQQGQQLRSVGSSLAEQGSAPAPFLGSEPRGARLEPKGLCATSTASENEDRVLDTEAIAKYAGALGTQMLLITGLLKGLDALVSIINFEIPFAANFALFFMFAIKSRIFNPLSNERPQRDTQEVESAEPARKMAEWTPPGIFFPIMWVLIIGPLRAASTALLVTGGSYCSSAVLALMLHLSIGDTWNTINNIERRYGTSVVGVSFVWISAAFAAYSYGTVDPLAGKLLSLPLIWLTIASSLIVRNWQLNPDETTGEMESLLPTKPSSQEGSITKLVWFEGGNE